MIHRVYHVKVFELGTNGVPDWPEAYEHVANVEADDLETAFELTNHIDDVWWANPGVTRIGTNRERSTGVNDVIVRVRDGVEEYWKCKFHGWEQINHIGVPYTQRITIKPSPEPTLKLSKLTILLNPNL